MRKSTARAASLIRQHGRELQNIYMGLRTGMVFPQTRVDMLLRRAYKLADLATLPGLPKTAVLHVEEAARMLITATQVARHQGVDKTMRLYIVRCLRHLKAALRALT